MNVQGKINYLITIDTGFDTNSDPLAQDHLIVRKTTTFLQTGLS